MLKLIIDSYKFFLKNLPLIIVLALPLLVLSALHIYFRNYSPLSNGIIYFAYSSMLLLPLVSAATDISIYRRLFHFNIINPLSSLHAFALYLFAQIGIGLIGTAPIFLFQYLFGLMGLSPIWCLSLAIFINIFTGFCFMAKFNVVLPLIIQNKVPSMSEFMAYTNRPVKQWLQVATLVYLPYVVLHYLTMNCPYTNMAVTTLFMFAFICFNVTYVNNNRLSRTTYKSAVEVVKMAIGQPIEAPCPTPIKKPAAAKKAPPAKKPAATKKPVVKKPAKKTAAPKLKPTLAKA